MSLWTTGKIGWGKETSCLGHPYQMGKMHTTTPLSLLKGKAYSQCYVTTHGCGTSWPSAIQFEWPNVVSLVHHAPELGRGRSIADSRLLESAGVWNESTSSWWQGPGVSTGGVISTLSLYTICSTTSGKWKYKRCTSPGVDWWSH